VWSALAEPIASPVRPRISRRDGVAIIRPRHDGQTGGGLTLWQLLGELQLGTDPGLRQAVLCGHGEQIGLLLGLLADGGLPIEPRCWPKGSTWVLDTNDGQVTGALAGRRRCG